MREKPRDLNLLRDALLAKRTASTAPEAAPVAALEAVSEPTADAVNTLELFEALPLDEQLSCMRAKEYDDLEQFKQKHYEKGKAVRVDINEVRRLVAGERLRELDTRLPQQLRDARDKFQSAGLTCETYSLARDRTRGSRSCFRVAMCTWRTNTIESSRPIASTAFPHRPRASANSNITLKCKMFCYRKSFVRRRALTPVR